MGSSTEAQKADCAKPPANTKTFSCVCVCSGILGAIACFWNSVPLFGMCSAINLLLVLYMLSSPYSYQPGFYASFDWRNLNVLVQIC